MKIDRAIRGLQAYLMWGKPGPDDKFLESVQLGIEALKQLRANRCSAWPNKADTLPGETKE